MLTVVSRNANPHLIQTQPKRYPNPITYIHDKDLLECYPPCSRTLNTILLFLMFSHIFCIIHFISLTLISLFTDQWLYKWFIVHYQFPSVICFSITHCNNWSIAVWVYRLKYDENFSYISVDFHLFVFNRQKEPDSFWMRCLLDAVTTSEEGESLTTVTRSSCEAISSGYGGLCLAFAWKLNFKCIFTILCCSFCRI